MCVVRVVSIRVKLFQKSVDIYNRGWYVKWVVTEILSSCPYVVPWEKFTVFAILLNSQNKNASKIIQR